MNIVDVVIPSLQRPHAFRAIESLRHIPFGIRLHLVTAGKSWPEAINLGLKESTGDVILMDDDVVLNADTFSTVEKYYNDADIFGFKLLFPDGAIQHAGGFIRGSQIGHLGFREPADSPEFMVPRYVAHATTSLIYIKRHVLKKLGGMAENYPGMQFEDVDFNIRAIKAGFRILNLPQSAVHEQSASKQHLPDFQRKMAWNYKSLLQRHMGELATVELLASYPKPYPEEKVNA
jgi:O-antigen biosynthesis protein